MNEITSNLVKDGNSMAVRIPKTAMKISGITGPVVLFVAKNEIIIKKAKQPRQGWATAIKNDTPTFDSDLTAWDALTDDALDD